VTRGTTPHRFASATGAAQDVFPAQRHVDGRARRDALLACAVAAVALAMYAYSLPPSFAFWDTGELQTVCAILGIAHPPACPAFVLLGWLFVHAVPLGEPAWHVNFMCSVAVAAATGLLYAVARRFGIAPLTGAVCALGFAFAEVTWKDATRAEVHDVALLFRTLAFFFALRWLDGGRRRDLFWTALTLGLAGATHGIALLLIPAIAVIVTGRKGWRESGVLALGVAGIALGLLPYLYLPLRSAYVAAHGLDPTVALGLPRGLPFWDYDHPATWQNFLRVVQASDFDTHSGFAGFVDVSRYPAYAAAVVRRLSGAFGYVGVLLAAVGAFVLVAARPREGVALVLAALLTVPFTETYTELQDPDRYYLLVLWCAAIAIGAGFERVVALFRVESARSLGRFGFTAGLVASFVAGSPNREAILNQRHDDWAPSYVEEVKSYTPDNAIVLADWAYSTPLAYAAYVQHALGHRIVVVSGPQQYAAYVPGWLAHYPVYDIAFDSSVSVPGLTVVPVKSGSYYAYRFEK
jgi:hypothetical protein